MMDDRLSQLLLATGWAMRTATGWTIFAADGTAGAWADATADETEALEAALAVYPTIARIHAAHVDQAEGHRASCASLRPNPCDCKGVTP